MVRTLKTLILVVLLTGLIWAWAEQSQTTTLNEQPIELHVVVPPDWRIATAESPRPGDWKSYADLPATVTFVGPQSSISELARIIEREEYPPTWSLTPAKEGVVELNLEEVLRSQPILTQMHTGVNGVNPTATPVQVARLKDYQLAVEPTYLDAAPRRARVEPSTVTVKLPPPVYERLREKVIRPVVPAQADLSKPVVVQLPAELEGYAIQLAPEQRTVRVVTDVDSRTYTIKSVPVLSSAPREFPWQQYELESEKDQWRKDITIRGPIEREPPSANEIVVYLRFEMDDLKETEAPLSRAIHVILPDGYELESPRPSEPNALIYFKFNKRP